MRFWEDLRKLILSDPRRFSRCLCTPGFELNCWERAICAQLLVVVSGVAESACGMSEKIMLATVNIAPA